MKICKFILYFFFYKIFMNKNKYVKNKMNVFEQNDKLKIQSNIKST